MTEYYQYPCGCKFEILGKDNSGQPLLKFDPNVEHLPLDCERTWDLISSGNTKGCFQLESRLGQITAAKLKPRNIEHLAALTAILRPGSLQATLNGKSITEHYIDRKNGNEEVEYFHPSLETILKETMGLLIFQESILKVANEIAGLDLRQCDSLRSAIGKKKQELIAKMKIEFLDGIEKTSIVTKEEGEEIYSWIEKNGRYGFNKCLDPATTYVQTKGGTKLLKDLNIGEYILGPDGFIEVIDIMDCGIQEVYYAIINSHQICCTLDHKFLCDDDEIRTLKECVFLQKYIYTPDNNERHLVILPTFATIHKQTINLEVNSNNHLFYANGIATSNSHAVSYAINCYLSAYAKAHFPRVFFTSYLYHAKGKIKPQVEIKELVNNAKSMNIEIFPPDIRKLNKNFKLIDKIIYFGLSDIKGIGDSIWNKILQTIEAAEIALNKKIENFTWIDFLLHISQNINSRAVEALIAAGALNYMGLPRSKMLFDFRLYSQLSGREMKWVLSRPHYTSSAEIFQSLCAETTGKDGACANKNRKVKIEGFLQLCDNPPETLEDKPEWLTSIEEELLGTAITCSSVDGCDTTSCNCTCQDFIDGFEGNQGVILIAGKVDEVKEILTKKGKNPGQSMAFITISDGTGQLESIVAFPDEWHEYRHLIVEGNTIMLSGQRSKQNSLVIKKIWQI